MYLILKLECWSDKYAVIKKHSDFDRFTKLLLEGTGLKHSRAYMFMLPHLYDLNDGREFLLKHGIHELIYDEDTGTIMLRFSHILYWVVATHVYDPDTVNRIFSNFETEMVLDEIYDIHRNKY